MAEDKPARTRFPKQYIIDRIDARMASLKSKDDGADVKIAAHEATKARNAAAWVRKVAVRAKRAAASAEEALGAVDLAKQDAAADTNVQAVAQKLYDAIDIPLPPWKSSRDWNSPEAKEADAARAAENDRKARSREIAALEHAKAYLVGTPVDEFSMHTLNQLKLTEVVAFSTLVDIDELPLTTRLNQRRR